VSDLRVSAHAKAIVLQSPARAVKRARYEKASKSQSQSTSPTSATSPHLQRAATDAHGDDRLPNMGTGQVGKDTRLGDGAVSLGAAKPVAQLCVQWTVELDMLEPLFVMSTGQHVRNFARRGGPKWPSRRPERPRYSGHQRTSSGKCLEVRRLELEMKWLKTVWQTLKVSDGSRLSIIRVRDIGIQSFGLAGIQWSQLTFLPRNQTATACRKGRPKVAPVAKRLDINGVQISTLRQGAGPAGGRVPGGVAR